MWACTVAGICLGDQFRHPSMAAVRLGCASCYNNPCVTAVSAGCTLFLRHIYEPLVNCYVTERELAVQPCVHTVLLSCRTPCLLNFGAGWEVKVQQPHLWGKSLSVLYWSLYRRDKPKIPFVRVETRKSLHLSEVESQPCILNSVTFKRNTP